MVTFATKGEVETESRPVEDDVAATVGRDESSAAIHDDNNNKKQSDATKADKEENRNSRGKEEEVPKKSKSDTGKEDDTTPRGKLVVANNNNNPSWIVSAMERTMLRTKGSLFAQSQQPASLVQNDIAAARLRETRLGIAEMVVEDEEAQEPAEILVEATPLQRNNTTRPVTTVQPGAVAINGMNSAGSEEESSNGDHAEQQRDSVDPEEQLFSATLVNEEEQEVVDAKPALEGFQALIRNNRFKYILVAFVIVVLAVVIPVAVLTKDVPDETVVNSVELCGSRKFKQSDYRGTINVTESGKPCQPWASQEPRSHLFFPEAYPTAGLDENYCRNPDGDERAWCYENSSEVTLAQYCSVPFCDGEDVTYTHCGTLAKLQRDYRGVENTTVSGKECMRWDRQDIHIHDNSPEQRPTAGLEANYCRNPDAELAAWCYTVDQNTRWEFCNVPTCEEIEGSYEVLHPEEAECFNCSIFECGTPAVQQSDYRGEIAETESGRECQLWTAQYPHKHGRTPHHYPDAGLEMNFCRNPDGEDSAWCYTTDPNKRWERCNVPACTDKSYNTSLVCGTLSIGQVDFRGFQSVTQSGHTCQHWATQEPHRHSNRPGNRAFAGLEKNYCRNPDGEPAAWCYTTNPNVRWDFCDVPACEEVLNANATEHTFCGSVSMGQSDYRGDLSVSRGQLECMRWDDESLQFHYITKEHYPNAGLDDNFCRNPNGELTAWCFVRDPVSNEVRKEACAVPSCEEKNSS